MGPEFEFYYKTVYWIFPKFNLITGIEKWVRVTVSDFEGKFLLCSKWQLGQVLELGINSYFIHAESMQTSDLRKILEFSFLWIELGNEWLISSVSPEIMLKCCCLNTCWNKRNEKFIWRFCGLRFGQ